MTAFAEFLKQRGYTTVDLPRRSACPRPESVNIGETFTGRQSVACNGLPLPSGCPLIPY